MMLKYKILTGGGVNNQMSGYRPGCTLTLR